MKDSISRLPVKRAYLVTMAVIALLIAATIGAKNLYFRGDYSIFFDGDNPQLQAFNTIQDTFSKTDNISFVIAPRDRHVFTPETMILLRNLTNDSWQIPFSSRVDSLANFQHTEAVEDDLLVEDLLLEDYPLDQARVNKVKTIALQEPLLRDALISAKGDVAVVNVTLQMPKVDETAEITKVTNFSQALLDKYRAEYPDVDFYQAGIVAMNRTFMDMAQQDSSTLVPAMVLIVLVFLTLMLRTFTAVLATLIVIIGSVTATMGISGWAGMFLSTATVNVPTLVLTLAVADCVHVIATMRQGMQRGMGKQDAIHYSITLNAIPVLITSATTAIGFLMMNASDSPILRDLGNLSALGIMIACFLSVSLLPALLTILPMRAPAIQPEGQSGWTNKLGNLVVQHRKIILPLSIVVLAGSSLLLPRNVVNDEPVKYFGTNSEFRQAADFMADNISGMTSVSIAIHSGQPQGIADPSFLKILRDFTDWLRIQPETDHVASLSDVFKRLNKNMHGDDSHWYRLPEDRALAAQYLLLYEMSLPYGLDLNNQLNVDKSSVKLTLTTKNIGSKELVAMEARIYDWFAGNAPGYRVTASSPNLMFAHIGETNMASMLGTLPVTLVLISALMIFALRSLRLGVISLIPNIAPAAIGFGIWSLWSGEINLGLSVVVTMTLGIVVDDAVHFLSKYQIARKEGRNAEEAVRYAFNTVGRALWITTVVLVAGFMVLASSSFRLNSDLGQLSALIIFIALVVDFLMLPTMLMLFDRKPVSQGDAETASPDNKLTNTNHPITQ
ncbi:MMPL family transporter [Photobacterium sp. CCB-ST2H9]|uniref:efflux RND transporter permease subunit n=1 Tax=Photobacterium sp. CCB-ST2H9 TaxID=2912855 RepID=UPI00200349F4|nr:MMPL family transporter [Photobacterium sp. CCB-ST2H9]UTM59047.1 MMPL family transporter [Photobacterium sp. CCB-ST2H9]